MLQAPSLLNPSASDSSDNLKINNLVFMDDSTLISSTKSGMESMLSITEEFIKSIILQLTITNMC